MDSSTRDVDSGTKRGGKEDTSIPAAVVSSSHAAPSSSSPSSSGSSSSSASSDSEERSSDSSSSDDSGEDHVPALDELPLGAHIVHSGQHMKAITTIAQDENGSRLVTGGIDGTVLVWDLARGLNARPFRSLATTSALTGGATDQAVSRIRFNPDNSLFAVARSDPQIRIYTRDGTDGKGGLGEPKVTTTRGDNYIRDMSQTKGHVGAVSDLFWNKSKPEVLVSSGAVDGTVRIWDIEHGPKALMGLELACTHILKTPPAPGVRPSLQALVCSRDSKRIIAGGSGSKLYTWDIRAGGVFSSMPDKSYVCKGSTAEFVCLVMDPSSFLCGIAQKDAIEMRDVRKLDESLWSWRPHDALVKGITFNGSVALIGTNKELIGFQSSLGTKITSVSDPGLSSNLIWSDNQVLAGDSDGSLVVHHSQRDHDALQRQTSSSAISSVSRHRDDDTFYANIDRSRSHLQDVILPAHEAKKIIKGSKRSKLDDSEG